MRRDDEFWLREALSLARQNMVAGEQPFAAMLVSPDARLAIQGANKNNTDATGHAELFVVQQATRTLSRDELPRYTIYSSAEPCLMCAGAIAWSGIGTLVFGVTQRRRMAVQATVAPPRFRKAWSVVDLLSSVQPPIAIRGPLLEEEMLQVHVEYAATLVPAVPPV
jgi:tRNA(Arg) A34 adenosine deaminase TadA